MAVLQHFFSASQLPLFRSGLTDGAVQKSEAEHQQLQQGWVCGGSGGLSRPGADQPKRYVPDASSPAKPSGNKRRSGSFPAGPAAHVEAAAGPGGGRCAIESGPFATFSQQMNGSLTITTGGRRGGGDGDGGDARGGGGGVCGKKRGASSHGARGASPGSSVPEPCPRARKKPRDPATVRGGLALCWPPYQSVAPSVVRHDRPAGSSLPCTYIMYNITVTPARLISPPPPTHLLYNQVGPQVLW